MGVEVFIWGQRVGALVRNASGVSFQYDPEYVERGHELSPIHLPLRGKAIYTNEKVWEATLGIPGLFYDSLPDRFGNNLLAAYFSEKGLAEHEIDVFIKLQYIGYRGMGALVYEPTTEVSPVKESIAFSEIEKLSTLGMQERVDFKTWNKDEHALLDILHIGTSAGGARAKALVAIHQETGEIRSGQLDWGTAYKNYVLKIDGANALQLSEPKGYGRLEFTYYQMATECGIEMSPCELYQGVHFMTERFDRDEEGNRYHIHSLCGLLGLDYHAVGQYSYEQYFLAARRLGLYQDAMQEIYRRMVFNVLAHNCDDHTKNFSFRMDQQGNWSLSPAFDVCYSYNASNDWVMGHNMTVNGKRADITYEDLMEVGERLNVKSRKDIVAQVQAVVNGFGDRATENGVKQSLIEEVEKNRPRLAT